MGIRCGKEIIFDVSAARDQEKVRMNGGRAPVTLLRAIASRLLCGDDVTVRVDVSPDLKTLTPFLTHVLHIRIHTSGAFYFTVESIDSVRE